MQRIASRRSELMRDGLYGDRRRQALHWMDGAGRGGAYGALRRRLPFVGSAAAGLPLGLAFFLVGDEALIAAFAAVAAVSEP